ncbi:hypothetical protein G7K_6830-t2 [Saitoella complicata NRRL Y-17804]|uniref:Uncharacterized protein n=1 Tax=Saitoella complicata (strain BCRC 22490 / CBS 7301 / JCM 7358 / NBRC 10748 / NRRL Y-17804) TaxID=698492 RepID=A0A0E9NS89_SAICN|nr:hypothetical protein G7K_6830-t2 [Saitoella complicata NRRL Y-17804]
MIMNDRGNGLNAMVAMFLPSVSGVVVWSLIVLWATASPIVAVSYEARSFLKTEIVRKKGCVERATHRILEGTRQLRTTAPSSGNTLRARGITGVLGALQSLRARSYNGCFVSSTLKFFVPLSLEGHSVPPTPFVRHTVRPLTSYVQHRRTPPTKPSHDREKLKMGSCFSSEAGTGDLQNDRSARLKTTRIDKQLEEDARKLRKECKILLLGSGESGKSTIVKQMKIIHQNGFSQTELLFYRPQIYRNLLDSARTLIAALQENELLPAPLPLDLAEASAKIDGAMVNEDYKSVLDASIVRACEKIWAYPATKRMVEDPALFHTFYLMDSAEYFFEAAGRISSPDYCPTESDVLRARTKTTGIFETRFTSGNLQIHMFDVGGQRSERKKWIHCFEAVTSIIFCVALSEYDQVLLEESGQNRMEESLVLWESVVNSRWFVRTREVGEGPVGGVFSRV